MSLDQSSKLLYAQANIMSTDALLKCCCAFFRAFNVSLDVWYLPKNFSATLLIDCIPIDILFIPEFLKI